MVDDFLDPMRRVFVVHGRNAPARSAMFTFLRAIGLNPIEWSQAVEMTGKGSPYIGDVLDAAFDNAQAVVVLFTPDDAAYLRPEYASGEDDPEIQPKGQARPNVLFEAGIAMGRDAKRTVLVELGQLRSFTDIGGRHAIRIDDTARWRNELAQRLRNAGCAVNLNGNDWLEAGVFTAPPGLNSPVPDKRSSDSGAVSYLNPSVDAWTSVDFYQSAPDGGRLEIKNVSPEPIYGLDVEFPAFPEFRAINIGLPIRALRPTEVLKITFSFGVEPPTGGYRIFVTGRTQNDHPIRLRHFIYVS